MPESFTTEDKMWIRHLVKELPLHETSPQTAKMISELDKSLSKIHAYFEDKDGIKGIIPRIEDQTTKHNGRLRKLEMKHWIATGAIMVLGWVSGIMVLEFKDMVKRVESNHDKILIIDDRFEVK